MFGDIRRNVWQHSRECLKTFPEYNTLPIPRVSRIPFPAPVFLVLIIAVSITHVVQKAFFSLLCCMIMTKNKLIFISTLLSLHIYHKNKILFCYCYYIHFAIIMTKNNLHYTIIIKIKLIKNCSIFSLMKFNFAKRFVHYTVVSPSGISAESYMFYYPIFLLKYCFKTEIY